MVTTSKMSRSHNFAAGPAALPTSVLERAQAEMLDYQGTGTSVMEMSHRSAEFIDIAEAAEADLRELLDVGDDYHVLFLQGGATAQFSAVPLNLLGDKRVADYVETGSWSTKAIKEAQRYCEVNVVATAQAHNFDRVPPQRFLLGAANARIGIAAQLRRQAGLLEERADVDGTRFEIVQHRLVDANGAEGTMTLRRRHERRI